MQYIKEMCALEQSSSNLSGICNNFVAILKKDLCGEDLAWSFTSDVVFWEYPVAKVIHLHHSGIIFHTYCFWNVFSISQTLSWANQDRNTMLKVEIEMDIKIYNYGVL